MYTAHFNKIRHGLWRRPLCFFLPCQSSMPWGMTARKYPLYSQITFLKVKTHSYCNHRRLIIWPLQSKFGQSYCSCSVFTVKLMQQIEGCVPHTAYIWLSLAPDIQALCPLFLKVQLTLCLKKEALDTNVNLFWPCDFPLSRLCCLVLSVALVWEQWKLRFVRHWCINRDPSHLDCSIDGI